MGCMPQWKSGRPSADGGWSENFAVAVPAEETSNWILITERIPFDQKDGDRKVDPAYDKMKAGTAPLAMASCPEG